MKKQLNKIFGLTVILAVFGMMALITSCEGPAGPAGKDGIGSNGTAVCGDCHGFDAPVWARVAEYNHSGHANGTSWERGSSGSCAPCHSGEGFALLARGKEVVAPSQPSGVNCIHCHTIHQNYDNTDFAPVTVAPVTFGGDFTNGATFDQGKGNICANCHQSRPRGYFANPGDVAVTSAHFGPHYGMQANTLAGNGYYTEFAGYTASGNSYHTTGIKDGCVTCHMPNGNHSFEPNIVSCNTSGCHTGLTNFDYSNVQTDVEALLETLTQKLVTAGLLTEGTDPETGDVTYSIVTSQTPVPRDHAGALWNFEAVHNDASHGVHNSKLVKAVLNASIKAFN